MAWSMSYPGTCSQEDILAFKSDTSEARLKVSAHLGARPQDKNAHIEALQQVYNR